MTGAGGEWHAVDVSDARDGSVVAVLLDAPPRAAAEVTAIDPSSGHVLRRVRAATTNVHVCPCQHPDPAAWRRELQCHPRSLHPKAKEGRTEGGREGRKAEDTQ